MVDEQGIPTGAVSGAVGAGNGPALRLEEVAREGPGARQPALSVADARTGRSTGIPPGRRMLLRVGVRLGCAGGRIGAGDLRAALVGDVLQRVAEIEGLQVVRVLAVPEGAAADFGRAAAALGVHPPVAVVASGDPDGPLGGPPDVQVLAADAERAGGAGVWLGVGPAGPDRGGELAAGLGSGAVDASALRLALLARPYREPVVAGPRELAEAAGTLRDWRRQVAYWAWGPSKPVPDEIRREAAAAFTGDLDTPAVLALLHRVGAASGLADGARFETFAALDRVLGLELTRDVGRG
ncbi:hypothetical protein ACFWA9_10535 [Kitasatospora sp. NPDC059973]|uniref:hypothetical protein n=1 Tax=Kitasatospora sp. NPDC059973 TaxID=3347020 RepID=UPI0036ADDA7B